MGSIPTRANEVFNIENEAKRGEFPHSSHNASRIRGKVGNGGVVMGTMCLNTRYPGAYYMRTKIIENNTIYDHIVRNWSLIKLEHVTTVL